MKIHPTEIARVNAALDRLDFLIDKRPPLEWFFPEIDWPTWRVRERPFDWERDG